MNREKLKTGAPDWTARFLKYAVVACAVSYIGAYLVIALLRIRYPFELEWMEGGVVDYVRRILSGQKIYVSPSLEFIPFIYTPLYFYVSALLSWAMGVGFLPLRLVSFISSLGSFAVIFLMVKRETNSSLSGILAAGLFAATFRLSGSWFDVARVDSLFLFLLLASIYLLRFENSLKSSIFAAVLISLSFLTKQVALVIAVPFMAYSFFTDRRRGLAFAFTTIPLIGLSTLVLNYVHNGWYMFYTFTVPREHALVKSMFVDFWTRDLLPLTVALGISAFYVFAKYLKSSRKDALFYAVMFVALVGGAWFSRLHIGGSINVLFPACAAIAILFGLGANEAIGLLSNYFAPRARVAQSLFYLVCILQFALLVYNPVRQVPTPRDLEAGRDFIHALAQMKGEVFVPYHGYLPVLAGKKTYAHAMALYDIWGSHDAAVKSKLTEELRESVRDKKFSAIILDSGQFLKDWFQESDFEGYSMREQPFFHDDSVFWPVTGMRTRPQVIISPKAS